MTFFRGGDHVRTETFDLAEVRTVGPDDELHIHDGFQVSVVHAESVTLLCEYDACFRTAERFDVAGVPYCGGHAPKGSIPVRPDPAALLHCVCGESLDDGRPEGVWTMADVACEYRTCMQCKSTRAWMPQPVVRGRKVVQYPDPESSAVAGEWDDLHDALAEPPHGPRATLVRNGVTLATTYQGVDNVHGWRVQSPEREEPLTDAIRVINPSTSPEPKQEKQP